MKTHKANANGAVVRDIVILSLLIGVPTLLGSAFNSVRSSANESMPKQPARELGQVKVVTPTQTSYQYTITPGAATIVPGDTDGAPTPTCAPGPWTQASPYPITLARYGFAQTATHFYVFGGVSDGNPVNAVNRMDIATGVWEARAPMPFTSASEAPTCALMDATGIVYCAEGSTGNHFAAYDIATDTWTPLASIPDTDHYGSASGAFNGKVFVAGGTNAITNAVQVYDVAANTWSGGTAAPANFLLAGYQQVGQYLYVVGGFSSGGPSNVRIEGQLTSVLYKGARPGVPFANQSTTWRLDMSSAPGVWSNGPAFTSMRADFGLAYDAGTNKLYAIGGDTTGGGFFDSTNLVDELALMSWPAGTWMASPPNLLAPNRQANQAGFYGAGDIWTVGGLDGGTFQFLAEVQRRTNSVGCPSPTPTCAPGPWTQASPYPITLARYGFAQTATHFYVFGGVSDGNPVNAVNRMNIATGVWEARAPMPFTSASEAPTCALMDATGIVYCAEGSTGNHFAAYDIATDTWTPLASIPDTDHYGSASGAFNGKVFVAGGTNAITNAVQVYDVAANTWSGGTAAPANFLLAGYQQVGQYLYVVGGFSSGGPSNVRIEGQLTSVLYKGARPGVPFANQSTTWRLDMSSAPGVWSNGPAFTSMRADFGLAYDAGTNKLYAIGGDTTGGGFFDSTNLVDELALMSWPAGTWMASPPNLLAPNRQANQAGFYGAGDIWTVAGLDGGTFQFLAEVQRRTNSVGCPSPTASPTPTATAPVVSPTPTPTPSITPTPSPSATQAAQALNLSTRLRVQPGDNRGIGGIIITGTDPKRVLFRGIGPSSGVPDALADPVMELHGPSGFTTMTNDNWRDTQEVEIIATGLAPTDDLESAIVVTLDPGLYTAIVGGKNDTSGVGLIEAYDLNSATANSKLGNISTRGFVETGNNVMIAGFILGGNSGDDNVIVRGIGPSLTAIGVPGALADPTLELHNSSGALIIGNNDWQDDPAQAAIINAAGLAPTDPLESAIAATLSPGLYTAILAGLNNGTGVGLVEAYSLGTGAPTPTATPTSTHFAVSAPGTVAMAVPFSITVTAQDQFNNTVVSYPGSVHFTSTSPGDLPADSTLTNGTGTFQAWLFMQGNQTVTATDSVNASITGTGNIFVGPPPPPTPY